MAMSGIVAVVVTFRRVPEVVRLVRSLEDSATGLLGCVVVDHEGLGDVRRALAESPLDLRVVEDPRNPGPGGGWAHGAKIAISEFGGRVDGLWFLDDDVVVASDTLEILLEEKTKAKAGAMAPLLSDASGDLWAFPEPRSIRLRQLIREAKSPDDALTRLGAEPIEFCWATGACLLVDRELVERIGFHRSDFWMLGEDLEYSMRIGRLRAGFFTCRAVVPHLPPLAADPVAAKRSDYLKFSSLLQNLSYLSFHVRGHMWRYLPGNIRRFFRTHGFSVRTLRDAGLCLWNGGFCGHPAGHPSGQRLRQRYEQA
jgi:GT2 family glycosyltransferase